MDTIRVHPYHKVNVNALKIDGVDVDPDQYVLIGEIADISTGASSWVVAPYAGTIEKIYTVIDGAITSANAAISFEIATAAVTDGGITIAQASSAAGDVDSATPSALNVVTAGQAIEIITDGGSTNAVKAVVTFVMQRS